MLHAVWGRNATAFGSAPPKSSQLAICRGMPALCEDACGHLGCLRSSQSISISRSMCNRDSPAAAAAAHRPGFLQQALATVEQAWLNSAKQTKCFQLDTLDSENDETVKTMRAMKLSTGHVMPTMGLGVYRSAAGGECYNAVLSALRLGYRHIDTAQYYGNEEDVGRALADSGVRREDVFITTKLWSSYWGYEAAKEGIRQSLRELNTPYVDLFLLHAPFDPDKRADTWRALEEAHKEGLIRSLGVSNFGIPHFNKLMQTAAVKPAVNQVELHPWHQLREEVAFYQQQGVVLEAYSPLAKSQKLGDPTLCAMAQRLGVTPAQVLIRWSLQKGYVPLPKSNNPERQRSNLDVFGFELSGDDMATLDGMPQEPSTGWDPVHNDPV